MPIRGLLSELKRRQVYRAVLVYATVAWVLLEGADIVFPRLGFDDWTVSLVLILAVIGFPVAVVLAWFFDITPEGIARTPPLSAGTHHHFSWPRTVEFLVIAVLVLAVGYLYVDRLSLQERLGQREMAAIEEPGQRQVMAVDTAKYRSIAVLPFADMSEAGDQDWFAEGVAEELLHALAGVEGLRVMARTSSFAFKDTDKTIAEIAQSLGVQAVLEGSVRRFGNRVRISAQLIDAGSGYHIWSESYERQLSDIFQLQDELAKSIVQTLRLELGAGQTERLILDQTSRPEAYNAFIRGRASLDFASPEGLGRSISYLETAVTADPDYAKAWGYLAFARANAVLWRSVREISGPTTDAYKRALELDPDQSEALAAKALMTQLLQRDWETAGILYQRALKAKENSSATFFYSLFYLAGVEQIPLAIELVKVAVLRDPLNAGYKSNLAMLYIWSGDFQQAITKAQEALELNPEHAFALLALLEAYTLSGQCVTALAVFEALPDKLQGEPRLSGRAAICYAQAGDEHKARKIYQHIRKATPADHAIMQAAVLAESFGDIEEAINIIEHEVDSHSWNQQFIRTYFKDKDSINTHPRYLALLERMGLDDVSIAELHQKMSFD